MYIAIIEDDPSQAKLISVWLEKDGHACKVFPKGKNFINSAGNEQFDLLIIDWMLPDINGDEVLRWARVNLGWEIPIVTTTMGIIGYIWSEGNIPIADHPEQFANLAIEFSDPIKSTPIKEEITKIKNSSPMLDDVAAIIKHSLQENA